jgi:tagatose-6-phosphate ketose/aldose isomerase
MCNRKLTQENILQDALSGLLALTAPEKQNRGLVYTPHEIDQQPATWEHTQARLSSMRGTINSFLAECGIAHMSQDRPVVLLVGAGTSDYIGRALTRVFRREWKCEVVAVPSTELLTNFEDYILPDKKYLLISFSRSGDSSEGVAVLELALERYPKQIRHLVITCNPAGAMMKLDGVMSVVLDDEVNDRGLAMTSSFTNMLIAGQYLANVGAPDRYEPLLEEMVAMGSHLIPAAANLASRLAQKQFLRMCFIGGGSLQAVAKESSLKVLELNAGKIATYRSSMMKRWWWLICLQSTSGLAMSLIFWKNSNRRSLVRRSLSSRRKSLSA